MEQIGVGTVVVTRLDESTLLVRTRAEYSDGLIVEGGFTVVEGDANYDHYLSMLIE